MDWEAVIIGAVGIAWGAILLCMRARLQEFSREGGRGLRDARVIRAVVIAAAVLLCAGGGTVLVLGMR